MVWNAMSVPFLTVREDNSRGAKNGLSQWQYDHWKARDETKGAMKKGKDSNVQRWQEDEKYRASQTVHDWTGQYCCYLDFLALVDIPYVPTWKERSRYEKSQCSNSTMDHIQGERQIERIFQKQLAQQGRVNPYILKNERERQRPFVEKLRSDLEWQSRNWNVTWS